jgi:hypothetical protein
MNRTRSTTPSTVCALPNVAAHAAPDLTEGVGNAELSRRLGTHHDGPRSALDTAASTPFYRPAGASPLAASDQGAWWTEHADAVAHPAPAASVGPAAPVSSVANVTPGTDYAPATAASELATATQGARDLLSHVQHTSVNNPLPAGVPASGRLDVNTPLHMPANPSPMATPSHFPNANRMSVSALDRAVSLNPPVAPTPQAGLLSRVPTGEMEVPGAGPVGGPQSRAPVSRMGGAVGLGGAALSIATGNAAIQQAVEGRNADGTEMSNLQRGLTGAGGATSVATGIGQGITTLAGQSARFAAAAPGANRVAGAVARPLAVAAGAIEMLQGDDNFRSGEGQGTTAVLPSDDRQALGVHQMLHGRLTAASGLLPPGTPASLAMAGAAAGMSIGNVATHAAEADSVAHGTFGRDPYTGRHMDSTTAAAMSGLGARDTVEAAVARRIGHGHLSEGAGTVAGVATTFGAQLANTAEGAGNALGDWLYRATH